MSEGAAWPLGATLTPDGVNFAIYSEHATRVMLCLYEGDDCDTERVYTLPARTGHVWHGFLSDVGAGQCYGYRIDGPYNPELGSWFNPTKLLQDPYAKALRGQVQWAPAIFGHVTTPHPDPSVPDLADSAEFVPKSVVVDTNFDWGDDRPLFRKLSETVIYECHLKGMTKLSEFVDEDMRGTYVGLADELVIRHLRGLGVTAVELLPVHAFVDEQFLIESGLRNYWGYNSIGFFAPEARYSSSGDNGGQVRELKDMVKTLHRAGLEVYLDVVYNHTAEGGALGPTLSFRGIDNPTYYRLAHDDASQYENFTGTGNSINAHHPAVVRMVLDSLRYWVSEFHIDGFRFDLATTLGRDNGAYEPKSKIFAAIHQDPILNQTKLFAEPWDIGPGGYQLGHFPADWSEWNDKFRDTTRSFWLGLPCSIGEFALRLTGSADLFDRPGRGPLSSVNYVTAHDGFDLVDLVSYSEKHNQENGQGNQDGSNYNLSANFGVEGHTTDPVISAKRRLARRNLFATLVLSHGIPMILGGDELSQGQGGNNNAYAQDNEISWIDWRLDSDKQLFLEFASRVMRLRKSYSSLAPSRYCSSERPALHLPEAVSWHDANGAELTPHAWARQRPRTLMLTSSDSRPRPDEPAILLIVSAEEANLTFRIPPVPGERPMNWFVLLDTSAEDGASETVLTPGMECEIHGPSIIVAEGRNLLPLGGQC